jgi:hypothetical protein
MALTEIDTTLDDLALGELDVGDDAPPCEAVEGCTTPATWRETHSCCGVQSNACSKHKKELDAVVAMFGGNLDCSHCHNKGRPIWNLI